MKYVMMFVAACVLVAIFNIILDLVVPKKIKNNKYYDALRFIAVIILTSTVYAIVVGPWLFPAK